jgi:hypothetical protein
MQCGKEELTCRILPSNFILLSYDVKYEDQVRWLEDLRDQ